MKPSCNDVTVSHVLNYLTSHLSSQYKSKQKVSQLRVILYNNRLIPK